MSTIQVGNFISTGLNTIIPIRSDVDRMVVINYSNVGGNANPGQGYTYVWQRGMVQGDGIRTYNTNGALTLQMNALGLNGGGFTLVNDQTDPIVGPAVATTASTNVVRPIVSTGSTAGLIAGNTVILTGSAANNNMNISGIQFTIDTIVANTSFRIANALANGPGVGVNGFYRIVNRNYSTFFPPVLNIVNITQAAQAVVTLSSTHNFTVGQEVLFTVPAAFGMIEINGLYGTIIAQNNAVATNTITVNINTTGFTAFQYPLQAAVPFAPATVASNGENTAVALGYPPNPNGQVYNILADASYNTMILGMMLGGGHNGPAGFVGDVIYWYAEKADEVRDAF